MLDKVLDDVLDEVVGEVVDRSSNPIYPIYYHHNVIYLYSRRREQKSIFHTSLLPNSERQERNWWLISGALVE